MTPPESTEIQVAIAELRKDISWLRQLLDERQTSITAAFDAFKQNLDQNMIQLNQAAQAITEVKGKLVLREACQERHESVGLRLASIEGQRQNFLGKESMALLVIAAVVSLGTALLAVWLRMR